MAIYTPNPEVPGFEGRNLTIQANGWTTPRLFCDGQPTLAGTKRGQFALRRNDGREVVGAFKNAFPDSVPILLVDGQEYRLVAPLSAFEWVWVGFPLVLIIVGGLLGGLIGGGAAGLNAQIFRGMTGPLRYIVTALISIVAVVAWGFIYVLLHPSAR